MATHATNDHENVTVDRRAFFRSALDKGGKTIVEVADANAKKAASHWIRPPYAINELEFLLACTRCGDCIEACPYDVIFALSARMGAKVAGTPALDLLNRGCHLCQDWPCVTSCEPAALRRSESDTDIPLPPKLANVSIDEQACLPFSGPECGACIGSCPVPGALVLDMCKPSINRDICTGCGLCIESCITEPKAIRIASLYSQ